MSEIILASSSEQRKLLLTAAGWSFRVYPANLDEQAQVTPPHCNRALYLAKCKADEVARVYKQAVVIAADTVVSFGQELLEKPASIQQAHQMLAQLSGQGFEVHTGVVLRYRSETREQLVITTARMRKLSEHEIDYYVRHNPVTTWSAGFSPAYPAGMALLAKVTGSFTGLTHGLPIEVVSDWLIELKINAS